MRIIELNKAMMVGLTTTRLNIIPSNNNLNIVLLLSEEDLLNDNILCLIKGYRLDMVLIPKGMKEIFLEDKRIAPPILSALSSSGSIEYF